jgi:predicted phosphodiesterase
MTALVVSDLHLTDRPLDAYRWRVFEQIANLSKQHEADTLLVLGDLCEMRDNHSSKLVNAVVDAFYGLRKTSRINEIFFLRGNHDGVDPEHPFFHFLRRLPWAKFFTEPTFVERLKENWLFLPHSKDPEKDWKDLDFSEVTHIFLHGTMTGAVSETGMKMEGISSVWFKGLRCTILAGDIHVPQKIGNVEYVGAPYPIRFGDTFQGRALVLKGSGVIDCPLENIRMVTVRTEGDLERVRKDDHVRYIIELADSEMGEWQERKKGAAAFCEARGAVLRKVQLERIATAEKKGGKPTIKLKTRTPEESLALYCRTQSVDAALTEMGQQLLKENP